MNLPGDRMQTTPLLIRDNGQHQKLEKTPFSSRDYQEDWLQSLIHNSPSLLPVSEIEPAFGPLVSIGREIPTSVGFIDNLLMSPQGYLTIVETKLWRNPEARREVVGQIIDYAKEISHWTFDELDQKVRTYNKTARKSALGVIDTLRTLEDIREEDESKIIDAITRHLQRGRFLLLVVGDGIRESVEAMADFLGQTPQLHFTLALVELQIYRMGQDRIVIPQVVMRTREVVRAIIQIEGGTVQQIKVELDNDPAATTRKSRRTLSEQDFFEELSQHAQKDEVEFATQIMHDFQDIGCEIQWRQASFVVTLPDPSGSGQHLTLLVVEKQGNLYVGWLPDQLTRIGLPRSIGDEYFEKIKTTLTGCERPNVKPYVWGLGLVKPRYSLLKSLVEDVIDQITSAANTQEG